MCSACRPVLKWLMSEGRNGDGGSIVNLMAELKPESDKDLLIELNKFINTKKPTLALFRLLENHSANWSKPRFVGDYALIWTDYVGVYRFHLNGSVSNNIRNYANFDKLIELFGEPINVVGPIGLVGVEIDES